MSRKNGKKSRYFFSKFTQSDNVRMKFVIVPWRAFPDALPGVCDSQVWRAVWDGACRATKPSWLKISGQELGRFPSGLCTTTGLVPFFRGFCDLLFWLDGEVSRHQYSRPVFETRSGPKQRTLCHFITQVFGLGKETKKSDPTLFCDKILLLLPGV